MQAVTTNNLRNDENTLLHGLWLIVARITWIACVVATLVIFFACIPVYIAQLETICSGAGCAYRQLSPEQAAALQAGGLSLASYAAYNVVSTVANFVEQTWTTVVLAALDRSSLPAFLPHSSRLSHQVLSVGVHGLERAPVGPAIAPPP
jgi:hypothetical protein